jgi:hypothetical protein
MRFRFAAADVSHGGLTPPAPDCMRDTPAAMCVSDSQRRIFPTGADAPRSWRRARCPVAGEITPLAMHKRTFTRAAGVSPPWCVPRTVADENRTMLAVSRTRNRERRGISPPWLDQHDGARSATIVGERTLCTSAARCQPAVGSETSSKWRAVFLNKNAACQPAVGTKCTCSGARSRPDENARVPRGLTPPARGCMRDTSPAMCVSDS